MTRESAIIKKQKIVKSEKAILIPRTIKLGEFTFHATVYVPKANIKKPKPKIALVVDVNGERARFVADTIEELVKCIAEIILLLEENVDNIELAAIEQSNQWLRLQQAEQGKLEIIRNLRMNKTNEKRH